MPNTRRPAAVVVSHPQTHPAGRQVLHGVDQVGEVSAEAVELPDHEHIALAQDAQAAVETRPVVADAGREVVVEVDRVVRRRPPAGRRAAGPATGSRRSRRGRSRSACVANERLRHGGAGSGLTDACQGSRLRRYFSRSSTTGRAPASAVAAVAAACFRTRLAAEPGPAGERTARAEVDGSRVSDPRAGSAARRGPRGPREPAPRTPHHPAASRWNQEKPKPTDTAAAAPKL